MRAVIDTNVWISALLSRSASPARLAEALGDGLTPVFCSSTFGELVRVAGQDHLAKIGLTPARFEVLASRLRAFGEHLPVPGEIERIMRDADDDVFLALAVTAGVDYLVSGDKDFLGDPAVREHLAAHGVALVTVREFVETLERLP